MTTWTHLPGYGVFNCHLNKDHDQRDLNPKESLSRWNFSGMGRKQRRWVRTGGRGQLFISETSKKKGHPQNRPISQPKTSRAPAMSVSWGNTFWSCCLRDCAHMCKNRGKEKNNNVPFDNH